MQDYNAITPAAGVLQDQLFSGSCQLDKTSNQLAHFQQRHVLVIRQLNSETPISQRVMCDVMPNQPSPFQLRHICVTTLDIQPRRKFVNL